MFSVTTTTFGNPVVSVLTIIVTVKAMLCYAMVSKGGVIDFGLIVAIEDLV